MRDAEPVDLGSIEMMDGLASVGSPRYERVRLAIDSGECLVACDADDVVGYVMTSRSFFEQPFSEVVFVGVTHRRRGVATALVHSVIKRCDGPKLFTSTNQSNRAAQHMFEELGFTRSGLIENLDDDDPELVYMLRVAHR